MKCSVSDCSALVGRRKVGSPKSCVLLDPTMSKSQHSQSEFQFWDGSSSQAAIQEAGARGTFGRRAQF